MTRLLLLAACFTSAFATYDTMAGDKMGASYMSGGTNEKNAMDMGSGSNAGAVDPSITVISKYMGGNAPMEQVSQPTMNKGATHMVTVGGDAGLVFSPNTIMAAPGDMVHFTFMSTNHTLTQSTFAKPCVKMQGGADSGFLPNPNNTISPPPTFMFQVKDTKPVWFYCKQKKPANHCGKGMTFSINPTAEKTQTTFMQMAMQQNGTAAAGAMGMGSSTASSMMTAATSMPAAAAPPPPSAASPPPAAAVTSPTYSPPPPPQQAAAAPPASMPAPAAAPAPQNMAAAGSSMVQGSGTMSNGQCSCSCLCGTAAFPAGAGIGMYGGFSGAVAM
ncbi:MAG: hypothetical protein Q9201_003740 [Fulgogasparrea decipioides]